MQIAIDFNQDREKFDQYLDQMIVDCKRQNLALTVPVKMTEGMNALVLISSMVSQVDCGHCDGRCCKAGQLDYINIQACDYYRLFKLDKAKYVQIQDKLMVLKYPCPYLKDNKCSIYWQRPQVCCTFPVQPATGGYVAFQVDCPQSEGIVKRIYQTMWYLINSSRG